MKPSELTPIAEEIAIPKEANIFPKVEGHGRFCMCLKCRVHYGDEDLSVCASDGCLFPPVDECENHFCYRHCKKNCEHDNV